MFSPAAPIRVQQSINGSVNNSQTLLPAASMSYLLLIVKCLYNPRYIMYVTLLSFGGQWPSFEGGYYYAHLGAACSGRLQFEVRQELEEIR